MTNSQKQNGLAPDVRLIRSFYVNVLGCKVNQYDARQIEELLQSYGLQSSPEANQADLVVVHTCGVTATAAQKSRQLIRRVQRENPLSVVAVTGCAAIDGLTSVDQNPVIRVPAGEDWLKEFAGQVEQLNIPVKGKADGIDTNAVTISSFGDQTRAFLKIQDGCDIGCAYCIVPQLRKQPRDKPLEVAVREAGQLVQNGYREIVIAGVSVGLYGRGNNSSLAEVLKHIIKIPDIGRVRMSSLHPAELTDELLELWAASPLIMPHLHLSLQSGSNAILETMRRGYTAEEYLTAVERARAALDNPAFSTDIIVGFPGETDQYFEECYEFCKQVGFARMHTFHFSPRPGTIAAKMNGQVDNHIVTERSKRMHQLTTKMTLAYHNEFRDRKLNVLVERVHDGIANGYSEHYIPVRFPCEESFRNKVVRVIPESINEENISGRIAL